MVQDFSKEVFNSKEKVGFFLNELTVYKLNEDVNDALYLLKKVDFENYSILLENLVEELQVIIVSKSNSDKTTTAVFRKEGYHKFYISGCKFCSNDFIEKNASQIFKEVLKGNYKEKIKLKSNKIIEKQVSLLNITRKVKTGWFDFFKKPDKIIDKTGMNVLIKVEP